MSLLKNITSDETIANEKDSTGSYVLESDLYSVTIDLAYVTKADSGAVGLVVHAKTDQGSMYRETLWVTSGTAKGCKNYYENSKGEKQYLPGFLQANALALLTVGKELSELDTETKVVKLYSKEAKAEVPTKVEVPTELLGQEVILGIIKETVDKTEKADDGSYVPTGDTRDQNVIDKVFRAEDKMTTAEVRAQADEAAYYNTWESLNKGKVKDRTKKTGGTAGSPRTAFGAKAATQGTKKPTSSLFATA